jgi:mannitol-1-phosphate 5-dehydrogenase
MSDNLKKAIHFGAGNIGRGFIGPLLVQSGYHVVFTDIDKDLIDSINEQGQYDVYILEHQKPRPISISNISGVMSTSDDIIKEIADPYVDMITTSVGVGVLPKIAGTLAKGIRERRKAGGGPINVIACENTIGATAQLAKAADQYFLNEDREYVKENVGFATCSVDRIVPPFECKSALDVGVEGFHGESLVLRGCGK